MSGSNKKILLDTNALIAFANNNAAVIDILSKSDTVLVSIISVIEFKIGEDKTDLLFFDIEKFIQNSELINLSNSNKNMIEQVVLIRKNYRLKLPDAIIAATAIINKATLITNDKAFLKIENLKTISLK